MNQPILTARGLEYRYPGDIAALTGADLEVRRGRRLALLGANGCGKTTLLLHLNGTILFRSFFCDLHISAVVFCYIM